MPSAAITLIASNRLCRHHRSDQLHRPMRRPQLGLQLGDAALVRGQPAYSSAGRAGLTTAVDAVWAAPAGDRLTGDPQRLGDLSDRPPSLDQIQHLAADSGG